MAKKIKASRITYRQGRKNLRRQRKEFIDLFKEDILKIYKDKTPDNLNDLLTKFRTLPIEQQNRLLESVLKFDSGANPKYTILDGVKQMIFHPIKRNKTLDYIITGQGEPKLFSSHRINPYNGLFGNDYKALGKVSKPIENGFIDAMIYGKEMNTNIGKVSDPLDFGIEHDYIKQNYPSKKVQYITTEPKILENQENIKPTIYYGAKGSFKTKMPGITINNQGIILEEGVRNDSTFVRGLDVYDFKAKDYVKNWLNDDVRFLPTIQHIDNVTTPVAVKTPWVYKDNINDIIGNHSGFDFLNFDFNTIDSNKSVYKQSNGIPIHFKMGGKQKQNKLNVNNGAAIPLGNDYFLMRGATHEQGGIDIGKDLEVENGEIIKVNPKSIKILSNAPIMNGISPAQMALGGLGSGNFEKRFNRGFSYQESYKKRNKLNDDGTKKKMGGKKNFNIDKLEGALYNPIKEKELIINPPLPIGKVYKDKKDYIGGTPFETRVKALKKIPNITKYIEELSNTYNIDKNLLTHRLAKEGWLDKRIGDYNKSNSLAQRDFWDKAVLQEVNAFGDLGLDNAATNLAEGRYNLRKDYLPYWVTDETNEKGQKVHSIIANDLYDALEFQAADIEYRQNELRKRGIPDEELSTYTNAAYNLGLYHKDLDNIDWIKRNYTVPNYYKLGGEMKNKQTKRNVSSTGGKKKALLGINDYPLTGAVVTEKRNQLPDLSWVGLIPTPKGIIVPKTNTNGIYNLGEFPTLDVPKYLEAPKGGLAIPQGYNKNGFKLPQSNVDGNISIFQANPNLAGNIVQGVANIGAATISGLVNRGMLNDLKYRPRPTLLQAGKLKTNFNINPQVREIKNTLDQYRRLIDKNTASSQVALARSRHGYVDALESLLGLRGQKENIETQLINQDVLNQQEVANKNIVNYDNWLAGKYDFDNAIREKRSENVISGIQTGTQALSDFITNNAKWRNTMANIAALSAAYPNVTPERMAASGVYYPLYIKQRIAKGKRR